jgi:toxin ParE1/3/4
MISLKLKTQKWKIQSTSIAERDFSNIILWTIENFSETQAQIYGKAITKCLVLLMKHGPFISESIARNDIFQGIRILHLNKVIKRGRHLIIYRIKSERLKTIEVLRILHEKMDMPGHILKIVN